MIDRDMIAKVFVGVDDTAQLAADDAVAQLNAWRPFRFIRKPDGSSVYSVTTSIERYGEGHYLCAITVIGPDHSDI